jgi:stress response protein YsnF
MEPAPPISPGLPNDEVFHVSEEELRVEKVRRETGRVRVSVTTDTVEDYVSETLQSKEAQIERVAIGQEVSAPPQIREEDGVIIIPVVEEVLVVEKRLLLKEEIRLHFSSTDEPFRKKVERRVQSAVVERVSSDTSEPLTSSNPNSPNRSEEGQ